MTLNNPYPNEPLYKIAYRIVDSLGSDPNPFQVAGKVASRRTLEEEVKNDWETTRFLVEAPEWYCSAISAHVREAVDSALHETDEWGERIFETFTSGNKDRTYWGRWDRFNVDMVRSNVQIRKKVRMKDEDRERIGEMALRAIEALSPGATMADVRAIKTSNRSSVA